METTRSFKLLQEIGFVRVGGTPEEAKAAEILRRAMPEGVEPVTEEFSIDKWDIKTAKLEILEPEYHSYTVTGYGLSGSTPPEGITADFFYAQQALPVNLIHTEGKIVLVNGRITEEMYRAMTDAKVAGFITFSGSVLDDEDKTDLEERNLRDWQIEMGKIPGVNMRVADAMEMIRKGAAKARLTLVQEEGSCPSHNLIAEIKGTEYPDEAVIIGAHYDSVPFSPGVYDNGAGSVIIMELLHYFAANPPKRTLRFIWFGSEEKGLLGSKAYVQAHQEALKEAALMINVDMAGPILGDDRAIITADESLCHMVEYLSKEVGFPITVKQDVYSSDSTPFADSKVPAISFARFGAPGAAPGHDRNDILKHLDAGNLENTTSFVLTFTKRLVNSALFPVPREIPENMVEAVDKYLKKKSENKKD